MPHYIIDPTQFTQESSETQDLLKALLIYLILTTASPIIPYGIYDLSCPADEDEEEGEEVTLEITHTLLERRRERHEDQVRYEIIDRDPFIEGGNGFIFKCLGVLMPEKNHAFKEKKEDKHRVCKFIPYHKDLTETQITAESSYSKMNKKLHSKNPVLMDEGGCLIMRNVGDVDLFKVLAEPQTEKKRFELTVMTLQAYINQVANQKLVHCDIKPENIVINTRKQKATVVDFALACNVASNGKSCKPRGTVGFVAPELMFNNILLPQSDLYSLGITLAHVWGGDFHDIISEESSHDEITKYYRAKRWMPTFKGMNIPTEIKHQLKYLIEGFTDAKPFIRLDAVTALERATKLAKDFTLHQHPPLGKTEPESHFTGLFNLSRSPSSDSFCSILEEEENDEQTTNCNMESTSPLNQLTN